MNDKIDRFQEQTRTINFRAHINNVWAAVDAMRFEEAREHVNMALDICAQGIQANIIDAGQLVLEPAQLARVARWQAWVSRRAIAALAAEDIADALKSTFDSEDAQR